MTTRPASLRSFHLEPEWILVAAALVLATFHYWARPDTIGVFSAARGWVALTRKPLDPVLYFLGSALLLGVVPVLAARWLTGLRPAALGLGLGRWRAGLLWLAVGLPLAVVAGKMGSLSPEMQSVYPLDPTIDPTPSRVLPYALLQFLYYAAWEGLFRGVLLFGLKDRLGPAAANALQTAISVTAHFGRPLAETFAAIPAGLVFGAVGLRVRSIWYVAVIHWLVGVSLDWFILTT